MKKYKLINYNTGNKNKLCFIIQRSAVENALFNKLQSQFNITISTNAFIHL